MTGPEPVVLPITPPPKEGSAYRVRGTTLPISLRPARAGGTRRRGRRRRAASRSPKRRHSAPPVIGLVCVGEVTASRPTSSAMSSMRAAWYGSETSTTSRHVPLLAGTGAAAASDSHDDATVGLAQDRVVGDAVLVQVRRPRGRLGEAVARLPATGDDDRSVRRRRRTGRARGRAGPRAPATAGRRTARHRARRSRPRAAASSSARALHTCTNVTDEVERTTIAKSAERDAPRDLEREPHPLDSRSRARAQTGERRLAAEHLDRLEQREPRGAALDRRVEHLHRLRGLELERLRAAPRSVDAVVRPLARLDVRDRDVEQLGRRGRASRPPPTTSGVDLELVVGDEQERGLIGDLHERRRPLLRERDGRLERADVEPLAVARLGERQRLRRELRRPRAGGCARRSSTRASCASNVAAECFTRVEVELGDDLVARRAPRDRHRAPSRAARGS